MENKMLGRMRVVVAEYLEDRLFNGVSSSYIITLVLFTYIALC